MNNRSGYFWQGNVAIPPSGLVTDGHVMIRLDCCNQFMSGILIGEWDDGEKYDDPDDMGNCEPRRVPIDKCWALWDEYIALPMVEGSLADTRQSISGPLLRLLRSDERDAYIRPHLVALVSASVTFNRITQTRNNTSSAGKSKDPLGPVVFWDHDRPVAIVMPARPWANDGNLETSDKLEFITSRPEPSTGAPAGAA